MNSKSTIANTNSVYRKTTINCDNPTKIFVSYVRRATASIIVLLTSRPAVTAAIDRAINYIYRAGP